MADVKGDLSGISQPGQMNPKLKERLDSLKLPAPEFAGCPVTFWDVFGEQGSPVRGTVSELGPLLLSRILDLNDTQEGVLTLVFKVCDDNGLLLLDLKDLRAALQFIGDNAKQLTTQYGNVSAASIGAIQRGLLTLEQQGGDKFFGEPALNVADLMQTDKGRGVINILAADKLMQQPRIYATFLLWMLSELYEALPEVGDPDKPKLVFFFDEAHLLFTDAPKALLDKIEQVVRLIRSKGVGVYFVTQNPLDIPDTVLGQLGNRVQHALRAFTPRDQKAVQTAATTMRANPGTGYRKGHHRVGCRRGAGLLPGRQRHAGDRGARLDSSAREPYRTGHAAGTRTSDQILAGLRPLRADRGSRVGLRETCGGCATARASGAGPGTRPATAHHRREWRQRDQCAGKHTPGLHRTARRTSRRRPGGRGQERRARGSVASRPRTAARRARRPARRPAAVNIESKARRQENAQSANQPFFAPLSPHSHASA